jgi:bifunctional ADP-heptose synthase (sugar kinase/adenylyltransferase)
MIVPTDELPSLAGKVTMVDGGFDPLHPGHVGYFRAAAGLGCPVLCNVSGDGWVGRKHQPLLPEDERVIVVDAIRYIDYTHLSRTNTKDVLERLRPRYYAKGSDWEGRLPAEELEICARNGTEVVFLDTVTHSSSRILDEYRGREGKA